MSSPKRPFLTILLGLAGVVVAATFYKAAHKHHHGSETDEIEISGMDELRKLHIDSDAGPQVKVVRELPPFTSIQLESHADFDIDIGTPQKVEIEAPRELADSLTTEVADGEVVVSEDEDRHHGGHLHHGHIVVTRESPHLHITVPSLERIHVEGAGRFRIHGLKGGRFEFYTEGASDLSADGKVDELQLHIEGASAADTRALQAKSTKVEVEGAGDVHVRAIESLEASIDGFGRIGYVGNPSRVIQNASGFGSIRHEDEAEPEGKPVAPTAPAPPEAPERPVTHL